MSAGTMAGLSEDEDEVNDYLLRLLSFVAPMYYVILLLKRRRT